MHKPVNWNPVKKEVKQLTPPQVNKLKICSDPNNVFLNVKCESDDFYTKC